MGYVYAVVGAGRQGTAAIYDMAKNGDAAKVLIGDVSLENAKKAAKRVNELLNNEIAEAYHLNVKNSDDLINFLTGVDAFLSSVPYYFNLDISKAAIKARASMCDLGGNTDIVKEQLNLDQQARDAGISIVPDCGQVPGMGTTLCMYAMSFLDEPEDVLMWDGGLPQDPRPPFNYLLTFNIEGLTNEYAEPTYFLRNWERILIQPFEELEQIEFDAPVGTLEAFTTGGGTSTVPWTLEGKLRTFQNKTVRYPGHFSQLRAYWDLGMFDLNPLLIDGKKIIPRKVLQALFEPKVTNPEEKDLVVIKIKCTGKKDKDSSEVEVNLIDFQDDSTGFTAMERTTGWDASITAIMMAKGEIDPGARPVEIAVNPKRFVEELEKRGIQVSVKFNLKHSN